VHVLDLSTFTWSRPATLGALPAARYHHSCTRAGRRVVLYGGINPRQAFDGVALVETSAGLGGELSAVADELARMSSSAASEAGARSLPGASPPGAPGGGHSLASTGAGRPRPPAARMPSAPPSLAGSAASLPRGLTPSVAGSAGGVSGDLMKLQLRDLLVKRHLEEVQLASAKKVEELAAKLEASRASRAAAARELRQARLVTAEAEARAAALGARAKEEAARAARAAADADAARGGAAAAEAGRAALEARLAQAHALLDSASRELGLLSSRHHRLQLEHAALQRARDKARAREAAAAAALARAGSAASSASGAGAASGSVSADETEEDAAAGAGPGPFVSCNSLPSSSLEGPATPGATLAGCAVGGGGTAAPAPRPCPHGPGAGGGEGGGCLLCSVAQCLAATQLLLSHGGSGASPATPAAGALPGAYSSSGGACSSTGCVYSRSGGAAGDEDAARLRAELSEARAALAASEAARAAAEAAAGRARADAADAGADADELRAVLARLGGDRLALAACTAGELRELEGRLDGAARSVRELVVERAVSEMQRRAPPADACALCMERRKGLVFGPCGHQACVECGEQLEACAFCRAAIATRIKLFAS
jgi:hypothetical protein